jgi:hypothetical protein
MMVKLTKRKDVQPPLETPKLTSSALRHSKAHCAKLATGATKGFVLPRMTPASLVDDDGELEETRSKKAVIHYIPLCRTHCISCCNPTAFLMLYQ